jgi:hypothetical protein
MNSAMAMFDGNSVYSFGGYSDDSQYPIQRLDMAEDGTIEQIELIGAQTAQFYHPHLFKTENNTCSIG